MKRQNSFLFGILNSDKTFANVLRDTRWLTKPTYSQELEFDIFACKYQCGAICAFTNLSEPLVGFKLSIMTQTVMPRIDLEEEIAFNFKAVLNYILASYFRSCLEVFVDSLWLTFQSETIFFHFRNEDSRSIEQPTMQWMTVDLTSLIRRQKQEAEAAENAGNQRDFRHSQSLPMFRARYCPKLARQSFWKRHTILNRDILMIIQ